jgi:hypothetical protein
MNYESVSAICGGARTFRKNLSQSSMSWPCPNSVFKEDTGSVVARKLIHLESRNYNSSFDNGSPSKGHTIRAGIEEFNGSHRNNCGHRCFHRGRKFSTVAYQRGETGKPGSLLPLSGGSKHGVRRVHISYIWNQSSRRVEMLQ